MTMNQQSIKIFLVEDDLNFGAILKSYPSSMITK